MEIITDEILKNTGRGNEYFEGMKTLTLTSERTVEINAGIHIKEMPGINPYIRYLSGDEFVLDRLYKINDGVYFSLSEIEDGVILRCEYRYSDTRYRRGLAEKIIPGYYYVDYRRLVDVKGYIGDEKVFDSYVCVSKDKFDTSIAIPLIDDFIPEDNGLRVLCGSSFAKLDSELISRGLLDLDKGSLTVSLTRRLKPENFDIEDRDSWKPKTDYSLYKSVCEEAGVDRMELRRPYYGSDWLGVVEWVGWLGGHYSMIYIRVDVELSHSGSYLYTKVYMNRSGYTKLNDLGVCFSGMPDKQVLGVFKSVKEAKDYFNFLVNMFLDPDMRIAAGSEKGYPNRNKIRKLIKDANYFQLGIPLKDGWHLALVKDDESVCYYTLVKRIELFGDNTLMKFRNASVVVKLDKVLRRLSLIQKTGIPELDNNAIKVVVNDVFPITKGCTRVVKYTYVASIWNKELTGIWDGFEPINNSSLNDLLSYIKKEKLVTGNKKIPKGYRLVIDRVKEEGTIDLSIVYNKSIKVVKMLKSRGDNDGSNKKRDN